ncbi:MAG: hypothetical protein HDR05_05165 [Lachnospiraceae bacterium]|nr:hypothetical protein [Lachnospiraceae bacterium]
MLRKKLLRIQKKIIDMNCQNHRQVILNQPLEDESNDWVGVKVYVDKLEAAINDGAKMIAVTSDFGSGKSSLLAMYKRRIQKGIFHFRPKSVYVINMWEVLEKLNEGGNAVCELHKTFLFHVINQLSPLKGSYISKRLSKNYGLFSIQSDSWIKNIILAIAIVAIFLGEGIRRLGNTIEQIMQMSSNDLQIIMYLSYAVGIVCVVIVVFRADFIFSSARSEGKREIDENVLIDYYNQEVLYKKFFRHYIFVIEDLDRTSNSIAVKNFLKEIRKYYLTDQNIRSRFHNNRVTFVVNIKPESQLKEHSLDEAYYVEKLYDKFFDYIINLRKINIDNYDAILEGLLFELREELFDLGLIQSLDEASIDKIVGMQWLIRGEKLGIREIKNRLNMSIVLYQSLDEKFRGRGITFEKCAVATYLITEYEEDFYQVADRDFEKIIEAYIEGTLDSDINNWNVEMGNLSEGFKKTLLELVELKLIDANYRTYFYNYPKESKLYDISEMIVFNSIVYNERPKNIEDYKKHLGNTDSSVIIDGLNKVNQLNMAFPRFIIEFEKIYCLAVNTFRQKALDILRGFQYDQANLSSTLNYIETIVRYTNIDNKNDVWKEMAEIFNEASEDKEVIRQIREKIIKTHPEEATHFMEMFTGENVFISKEEIDYIGNIKIIMQIINYSKMGNCFDECILIHKKIIEDIKKNDDYIKFYLSLIEYFGIEECYDLIYEYCISIKEVPDPFIEVLVAEVNKKVLSKEKYVDLLEDVENLSNNAVESLASIVWIGGLSAKVCNRLAEMGKWIYYVCNMAVDRVNEIDLRDNNVIQAIEKNTMWLYEYDNTVWLNLRTEVLKQDEFIPGYMMLFNGDFPIITQREIMMIANVENAIMILKESVVTESEVDYIAQYFNQKSRNSTESYNIFQYILGLKEEVAERLFYALNINRGVQYRRMSKARKNEISTKLITLLQIKTATEKIKFMKHIGVSIDELEKDLYIDLNKDDEILGKYLQYINSLETVEDFTIKNIVNLANIQIYSSTINKKLYEMGEYASYVSSRTRGMRKFEMEEDKKSILWETYKRMFNGTFNGTRKYMLENKEFLKELVDDHAYEKAGDQITEYIYVMQSMDLLRYVFDTLSEDEAGKYFAHIEGFDSFEAADYFVKRIIDNGELLDDDKIYNNTHDKLINPGLKAKYTRARNKSQSIE